MLNMNNKSGWFDTTDINNFLFDQYGSAWDGRAMFRVVYSEDQFETRLTHYTDAGVRLITPEYREYPKYRQYIENKYILEQLVIVPSINDKELVTKTSYEPLWVFETGNHEPLPPNEMAAKFVIDTVRAAIGKESLGPKYKDPELENPVEVREQRLDKLQEELFGNETEVGDALAYGEGVAINNTEMWKDKN